MNPSFVRLDVFSPFMRKKVEKAPKCGLGCRKKNHLKKIPTNQPEYSEIPLWGQHNFFHLMRSLFFFHLGFCKFEI